MLYSGFGRKKAILANILVALTGVFGGFIGYYLHDTGINLEAFILPFAAGGFLYISSADLLPEIRKETNRKKSLTAFSLFLIGILLMILIE